MEILQEIMPLYTGNVEAIWMTVLVLLVLKLKYPLQVAEWQLIAKKSKKFLQNNGVSNPDLLISKVKLD